VGVGGVPFVGISAYNTDTSAGVIMLLYMYTLSMKATGGYIPVLHAHIYPPPFATVRGQLSIVPATQFT